MNKRIELHNKHYDEIQKIVRKNLPENERASYDVALFTVGFNALEFVIKLLKYDTFDDVDKKFIEDLIENLNDNSGMLKLEIRK